MRRGLLALALCLTPAVTAFSQEQNLIFNGAFVLGLTGWRVNSWDSEPGHVGTDNDEECQRYGCHGHSPAGTFASFNGGDKKPNATLAQTVATQPGGDYLLTFSFGVFDASGADSHQTLEVNVSWGDRTLKSLFVGPLGGSTDLGTIFKSYSLTFTAIGDHVHIQFTDISRDTRSIDGMLTLVSLTKR